MISVPHTKAAPSKITGPYPLLALFLLVVEGLLGLWLFRADTVSERIVAGTLMVLLLAGFLVAFILFQEAKPPADRGVQPIKLPGVEVSVNPATAEVTATQLHNPEAHAFAGPDGRYTLEKPPEGWDVRELTWPEYMADAIGVTDLDEAEKRAKALGVSITTREILQIRARNDTFVTPVPGKTRINGQPMLTALSISLPTQLVILPVDRRQPPVYVERSFTENFLLTIDEGLRAHVLHLRKLSLDEAQERRRRHRAEFRQDLEGITVNGRENQSLSANLVFIGIEGDRRDHLLRLQYPSLKAGMTPELTRDIETLSRLVDSFRPLERLAPEQRQAEEKRLAEEGFRRAMDQSGPAIFWSELGAFMLRIKTLDLDDASARLSAMRMLAPFEQFAQLAHIDEPRLTELWAALHEAERGDASKLKVQLDRMLRDFATWLERAEQGAVPPRLELVPSQDVTTH